MITAQTQSAITSPPRDYQQWLACFNHLRSFPMDAEVLRLMEQGELNRLDRRMTDQFLTRLDELVRQLLRAHIDRFMKDLDQLLESGDLEGLEIRAGRFSRRLGQCLFFEQVAFLPDDTRRQLSEGYRTQIHAFWQRLVRALEQQAEDARSGDLEELAYRIRRIADKWKQRRVDP